LGDNSEVTVFAHLPHTHNTGVSFYSTIVRNGTEVEFVANNKYYDNAFQVTISSFFFIFQLKNHLRIIKLLLVSS